MDIVIREIEEKDYPAVTSLIISELSNNKASGDSVAPFFNKVKNDESYKTLAIDEYMDFYNTRRLQEKFNCMTPIEYRISPR